jgi:branched-chain amino acid transport system ATP-binding protein
MLQVTALESGYGATQVLFGVSFQIERGQVVTLLGRNGMGKTTTIKSIMGIVRPAKGIIVFNGKAIHNLPSYRVARAGIGLVPEGRQIFQNLTVRENLVATAANRHERPSSWDLTRVLDIFPLLQRRLRSLGGRLSGGEQQMVAIGRALMTNPLLLILDEATEGLAPLVRAEIWLAIEKLKAARQSILIVDKNIDTLVRIADRHFIIEKGRIVWSGNSDRLRSDAELQRRYLGI